MSKEENEALVCLYFEEFLDEGNLSIADQVLARAYGTYTCIFSISSNSIS